MANPKGINQYTKNGSKAKKGVPSNVKSSVNKRGAGTAAMKKARSQAAKFAAERKRQFG